ncbi:hypothetical protein Hypma_003505 [Hypsizygus marmoreus]|uniref:F-box domain-containing protein n=1 Tax=Hypsizygus marmoreus TaxID=39966 RepID=A0A369J683_HYPMA|nr:hypothetical protein Hypma_003505 [Hypsizygus marmoreus]
MDMATTHRAVPTLLSLPLEILDTITFALTSLQPLGPPSILLPLLLTCKYTHALLSPHSNPGLYARIFRYKFDAVPVLRRAFESEPSPTQYVDQLMRYCTALRVLRRGNVFVGSMGDVWGVQERWDEEDMGVSVGGLGDVLMTGVVMMMEDEGRNVRQLVQWAGADVFVDRFVRGRLYDGAHANAGWPVENEVNACALWLMWLLTTEERLYNETPAERQQMLELLQPIVTMPYRYPVGEIPPQHFTLPLPSSPHLLVQPTTIPTLHGPYPVYPSPTMRLISRPHYGTRPVLSTPLISSAARLLYFARDEVVPLGVPPHFANDRRESWAQGRKEIGQTREDVEEFNWGWTVRLPLGRDEDEDIAADTTMAMAPGLSPFPDPRLPHARWAGKAPHSKSLAAPHRSRKWDADWWRLRLCGDPTRRQPWVPIGRVYEPGCMDGLWQGMMTTPTEASIQALLNTALHPPHGTEFTERTMTTPVYMRLSELHGVLGALSSSSPSSNPNSPYASSSSPSSSSHHHHRRRRHALTEEHPFAYVPPRSSPTGEGMNNAWFAGPPKVREREDGLVELEVPDAGVGVFRRGGLSDEDEEEDMEDSSDDEEDADDLDLDEWDDPADGDGVEAGRKAHDVLKRVPPLCVEPGMERDGEDQRCDGVREIVLFGEYTHTDKRNEQTDPTYSHAFSPYTFHGRVRPYDGLIGILRSPHPNPEAHFNSPSYAFNDVHIGQHVQAGGECRLFYGYLVGGDNFVGSWRVVSEEVGAPAWEGAFCLARRED